MINDLCYPLKYYIIEVKLQDNIILPLPLKTVFIYLMILLYTAHHTLNSKQ